MTNQIPIVHQSPDLSLLTGLTWGSSNLQHEELTKHLIDKNPYSITAILENLDYKFYNNPKYVKKTKYEINTKYNELIFDYFFKEFGVNPGNDKYGEWLKVGMTDDDIFKNKLEVRYLTVIAKRFKNLDKLKLSRNRIDRKRYYHLPEPLNHVDWRTPYDNLFVWTENNQKYIACGGSGFSGARETNSRFIYAFGLLNQQHPVPSFLYVYTRNNKLFAIKDFSSFTTTKWDISSNYHISEEEEKKCLRRTTFLEWHDIDKLKNIEIF